MDSFEGRVSELRESASYPFPFVRGFWHEDGSFTAILQDYDCEHANPRDNDGNVARLVMQSSDYRKLDEPHGQIEYAAERWGIEHPNTARYVSIFLDDVAAFEPRWTVSGSTQSDWAYGYAYALAEDVEKAGLTRAHPRSRRMRAVAAEAIEQELKVYGLYFAGEVYGFVHVEPGGEIVTTDIDGETAECRYCGEEITPDERGDWTAENGGTLCEETDGSHRPTRVFANEDSCWGFLGYDDLEDIAADATDSPITETVWS